MKVHLLEFVPLKEFNVPMGIFSSVEQAMTAPPEKMKWRFEKDAWTTQDSFKNIWNIRTFELDTL